MSALWLVYAILFIVISTAIWLAVLATRSRMQGLKHKDEIWKKVAEANGLTFVPPTSWLATGHVTGLYRGRRLKLEHFMQSERKRSVDYTRVRLSTFFEKEGPLPQSLVVIPPEPLTTQIMREILMPPAQPGLPPGEINVIDIGEELEYKERALVQDENRLQAIFDRLYYLADAYDAIWERGAETIPLLKEIVSDTNNLNFFLGTLARDIARDTRETLGDRLDRLLCPRCLTRFAELEIGSWLNKITYCGCRTCSQSLEFLEGPVVAVLDSHMAGDPLERDGTIYINWSSRRELFDFDAVEIRRATDEEVERFAVQAGNDTDPYRQPYYKEIPCAISPDNQLSPNALRILESQFGQVS